MAEPLSVDELWAIYSPAITEKWKKDADEFDAKLLALYKQCEDEQNKVDK